MNSMVSLSSFPAMRHMMYLRRRLLTVLLNQMEREVGSCSPTKTCDKVRLTSIIVGLFLVGYWESTLVTHRMTWGPGSEKANFPVS